MVYSELRIMTDHLERNKQSATDFYNLMFNESRPREGVERFVGDDYIQHNPHVANGKDGFIAYNISMQFVS
jgi:predicted SnoaL-like aldol condensation-catalyzing enzyme